MMKTFDFKTSGYFPWHMILVGGVLAVVSISMLVASLFIGGLIVLLISLLILTTHYRCRIDFDKKVYQDYVWVLGMRNGAKTPFDDVQYIFIKQSQESHTMGLRAANTTIHKSVYDGYLKFSETDKIHIVTKENKEDLIQKLRPIATKLQIEILDYTVGDIKSV